MSLGTVILVLAVYVLAVMRIVRLINYDTVLDWLRIAVARRAREDTRSEAERARWSTAEYFLSCPWCVGFWVCLATAIVPVMIVGWPWWALFGVALAGSHLVGVAAPLSSDEDIDIEAA